jgi:hypothetical protein
MQPMTDAERAAVRAALADTFAMVRPRTDEERERLQERARECAEFLLDRATMGRTTDPA